MENTIRKFLKEYYQLNEWGNKFKVKFTLGSEDYDTLIERLGDKNEIKIANNLTLRKTHWDDNIYVRLYNTDIIQINKINNFKLNMGNWDTQTTRRALNTLLPHNISIYSDKGRTVISGRNGVYPFHNGIVVTQNGDILHN